MKMLIAIILFLSLISCSSAQESATVISATQSSSAELASSVSAPATLEERLEEYAKRKELVAESYDEYDVSVNYSDEGVVFNIWYDGYGEEIEKTPGAYRDELDIVAKREYDLFLHEGFEGIDFTFYVMDDRNPERIIYIYSDGEFRMDLMHYEEPEIITYESLREQSIDSFMSDLKSVVEKNDNYTLERDDLTITLTMWDDDAGKIVNSIKGGDSSKQATWDKLKKALSDLDSSIYQLAQNNSIYSDVLIRFTYVSPDNHEEEYLVFENGELVYDIMEEP